MAQPEAALDKGGRAVGGGGNRARWVALGIVLSRLSGLARQAIVSRLFGTSAYADVWVTALRTPNLLQNLLGEQTLSAAFIPIYARLVEEGRREDAGRFAGAIFALLLTVVSAAVLFGVFAARWIVAVVTPGYLLDSPEGVDRYSLAVEAARISFPMAGLLVLSAWALGILNSHRRFLLPYAAPVLWNAAIVTALLASAGLQPWLGEDSTSDGFDLAALEAWLFAGLWGGLIGGLLQLLVQLPLVLRLAPDLRVRLSLQVPGVDRALAAFGPALAGRGVVQLALYINVFLASFLAEGAQAAVQYAALIYALPLSVFGMAVAASELPELARGKNLGALAQRVRRGLQQAAFLVLPSTAGFLAFATLVVALLYGGGQFEMANVAQVALVLTAYSLGLPAATASRLLQNTFFALGDTRTPARIAGLRVALALAVAVPLMLWLDRYSVAGLLPSIEGNLVEGGSTEGKVQVLYLGAVGLALAEAMAAWAEFLMLRRSLAGPLPELGSLLRAMLGRMGLASLSLAPALLLWRLLEGWDPRLQAMLVLPLFALAYLLMAWRREAPELQMWLGRWRRP